TSGLRLGSPALTSRGFKEDDMAEVADIIALVLDNPTDEDKKVQARERVAVLCKKYPIY
ncbi:MAG: serine hydroxymethyltransferase, partial [Selenomonadaceae bacterium]|nr:serine hydroxymethyltransferase [Selenomonadaceae bacterium]